MNGDDQIVCKSFYDQLGHLSQTIRIAERLNMIQFVEQTDSEKLTPYRKLKSWSSWILNLIIINFAGKTYMEKTNKHGGARPGAGRKKLKEPNIQIYFRVPKKKAPKLQKLMQEYLNQLTWY